MKADLGALSKPHEFLTHRIAPLSPEQHPWSRSNSAGRPTPRAIRGLRHQRTMNRALLGSLGTAGGTIVALGGGTLLLSNTCLVIGRAISKRQRVRHVLMPVRCQRHGNSTFPLRIIGHARLCFCHLNMSVIMTPGCERTCIWCWRASGADSDCRICVVQLKHAVDCASCDGKGLVQCSVCRGTPAHVHP